MYVPISFHHKSMTISSSLVVILLLRCILPSFAVKDSVAAVLRDNSSAAANLFNTMRTPAGLVGGAVVPLGLLTAPPIRADEPRKVKLFKKANILLAVASLVSELLCIIYSTVAMNNLAGYDSSLVQTRNVAELISKHFEMSWIAANVHFLFGTFGLCLLVGSKAHFMYGDKVGRIASCWSVAAFFQCIAVVNRSIAQGGGPTTAGLFWLTVKYVQLVVDRAKGQISSMVALGLVIYSLYLLTNEMLCSDDTQIEYD